MSFPDLPIHHKLRGVYLLTSGLALLLASLAFVVLEVRNFRSQLVDRVSMQADLVGYNAASAILFDDRKAAEQTLGALRLDPEVIAAAVYGADGQRFASWVSGGAPLPTELAEPIAVERPRQHRFSGDTLLVHEDVILDGERIGSVRVLASLERLNALLLRYAAVVLVVFLVSLAAAWPLLLRLQRGITTPIMELVDKARIVSTEKNYGVRAKRTTADELGLLVDTFNDMLAEIQKRDAALQRARDVAEAANRAKDEFLAVVSHELRTPLTPILAWARMQRARVLDPETAQRSAEIIERNAKSQAQLIEDLLDVSRITAGKLTLDLQPVDIAPVVEGAVEAIRSTADLKGVRLEVGLDRRAGIVSGDAERLRQVVSNLLANAVKFTPRDGKVTVVLRRVESRVSITVRDTGLGITADLLPYVFERFWQADATSTRAHGGLGLGLSIARHIVEMHGGTIRAESQGQGKGATFTVELPAAAAGAALRRDRRTPAAAPIAPAGGAPHLEGIQVLAVDDDLDTLDTLRTLLEQHGAEVRTAESAEAGIRLMDAWQPDLIISDIGMPHADGYEFIRQVRARPAAAGGRVPALALTAFARSEDRRQALHAGFQLHLSKPIEPEELVAVVASLATVAPRGH